MREASAAYDAREYARCLEMLAWVAEHAAPSDEPAEADRLRRAAQAALAREQEEETSVREARRRCRGDDTVRWRKERFLATSRAALESRPTRFRVPRP